MVALVHLVSASLAIGALSQRLESASLIQVKQTPEAPGTSCLANMMRLVDGQWVTGEAALGATKHPHKIDGSNLYPSDSTSDQRKGIVDVFVYPEDNFAMCIIQKNACSTWGKVLNKVLTQNLDAGKMFGIGNQSQIRAHDGQLAKIFSDPEAVRAVMVRDPLERFASAYLNKCFAKDCSDQYCFARNHTEKGRPISFKEALRWAMRTNMTTVDPHWRKQSHHCELYRRLPEFNVVAMMTKDTLAEDASCLMKEAGMERFNFESSHTIHPFWKPSRNEHPTGGQGDAGEEVILKKLFSKESAMELYDYLAEDYKLFHLPLPTWVTNATGEWEEALTPDMCDKTTLLQGGALVGDDDEDDIAVLARRAGFV